LGLLFSQFGTVVGCEIIRDHLTGDSLCFGFIEFEDRKSCERAYLKMDNALIDDRRVHVDFSQSTSKNATGAPSGEKRSRYSHLQRPNNDHDSQRRSGGHTANPHRSFGGKRYDYVFDHHLSSSSSSSSSSLIKMNPNYDQNSIGTLSRSVSSSSSSSSTSQPSSCCSFTTTSSASSASSLCQSNHSQSSSTDQFYRPLTKIPSTILSRPVSEYMQKKLFKMNSNYIKYINFQLLLN
jgi:RNA recognition motif-containing protein